MPRFMPIVLCIVSLQLAVPARAAEWNQFGGSGRDFTVSRVDLSVDWPDDGPPQLWSRPLGEGFSGIAVSDGMLYTMLRRDDDEVSIALKAATGETVWEVARPAPFWDGLRPEHGPGPHATPLVTGGRVYTVGIRGLLLCIDAASADVLWSRDLWHEYGSEPGNRGYSSSPMAHGDTVILPVGGEGQGLVAFDLETGEEVWKGGDFAVTFSSPKLIRVDGQDQLVLFGREGVHGLDPGDGTVLWSHPHDTRYGLNISLPVWSAEDNLLLVSAGYDSGARGLHLSRADGRTTVKELWYNRGVQVHHGSAVRLYDTLYASSGTFGPAFLTGADARTGEIRFRQRGFAKANLAAVGGRLLILDEDGVLAIGMPGPDGIDILSKAQILTHKAWTAPTVSGSTVYLRDRETIAALDLAPQAPGP